MIDYQSYINYIKLCCDNNNLETFKSNPNFTWVLEHTSYNQGLEYLEYSRKLFNISEKDIKFFCTINDEIGGPQKFDYDFAKVSPSSLRYIFHSNLILNYMKSLNLENINICEIGGGYGGLCLAINYFSPNYNINISSYNIIDLYEITRLQENYLDYHKIKNVKYYDAFTYGEQIQDKDIFLISNYCFSEIEDEHQKLYIEKLFSKVSHGFMCWNHIKPYNFGFDYKEETEYPFTGNSVSQNKYIYF
jgi:hypothetical protein